MTHDGFHCTSVRTFSQQLNRVLLFVLLAAMPPESVAQEIRQVEIDAPSVGRKLTYAIALPARYQTGTDRYPVLYMLHGFSGNFTQWQRFGATQQATTRPMIIVMPDGGNSWFINWARSEGGQQNRWEDFLARDLVQHVDANYRTIPHRAGRALCGLSMGGYGAIVVGLRNPDLYCSLASESGALAFAKNSAAALERGESLRPATPPDTKPSVQVTTPGFSSQAERTPAGDIFLTPADCAAHDPYRLVLTVPRERLPAIFLDCGTDDPFLPQTRELVEILLRNRLPFTYAQSPGDHRREYWQREVGLAITVQSGVFQRALAAQGR